jgi:sec-independent protein translocase protein TatC
MWESLLSHALSLRVVLMRVAGMWIALGALLWMGKERLLDAVMAPVGDLSAAWVMTGLTGMFATYFKLVMLAAFLAVLPYALFELYRFIRPGLYRHEKRYALPFFVVLPGLTLFAVWVSLFYVAPLAAGFFLGFGHDGVQVMPLLSDYFDIVFSLALATLAVLLMPLGALLMVWWRWVTPAQIAAQRRWVLLLVLIVCAVLTPPDPFSMLVLAVPAYLWFEAVLLFARRTVPAAPKK